MPQIFDNFKETLLAAQVLACLTNSPVKFSRGSDEVSWIVDCDIEYMAALHCLDLHLKAPEYPPHWWEDACLEWNAWRMQHKGTDEYHRVNHAAGRLSYHRSPGYLPEFFDIEEADRWWETEGRFELSIYDNFSDN